MGFSFFPLEMSKMTSAGWTPVCPGDTFLTELGSEVSLRVFVLQVRLHFPHHPETKNEAPKHQSRSRSPSSPPHSSLGLQAAAPRPESGNRLRKSAPVTQAKIAVEVSDLCFERVAFRGRRLEGRAFAVLLHTPGADPGRGCAPT